MNTRLGLLVSSTILLAPTLVGAQAFPPPNCQTQYDECHLQALEARSSCQAGCAGDPTCLNGCQQVYNQDESICTSAKTQCLNSRRNECQSYICNSNCYYPNSVNTSATTYNDPGSSCGCVCNCSWPVPGCPNPTCNTSSHQWYCNSPILIDVAGDGFDLTCAEEGVIFDLGFPQQLAWTTPDDDDGWLALDRNRDGVIDDEQELFGNGTPQPQPPAGELGNGFEALAVFDRQDRGGNENGLIDRGDAAFPRLRIWQDVNHNGISEPDELVKLADANLCVLDLLYVAKERVDEHGNVFYYRARVWDCSGRRRGWAWDVFLMAQPQP